jgi:hypothetical protein
MEGEIVTSPEPDTMGGGILTENFDVSDQTNVLKPLLESVTTAANQHLSDVLRRLAFEKEDALKIQEEAHQLEVARLNSEKADLQQLLVRAGEALEAEKELYTRRGYKCAEFISNQKVATGTQQLMSKYFAGWFAYLTRERGMRQLERILEYKNRKAYQMKCFMDFQVATVWCRLENEIEANELAEAGAGSGDGGLSAKVSISVPV